MKMKFAISLTISALAFGSTAAFAVPVEEKALTKGKFTFDEEMGYIYLHGPSRLVGYFLKVPSDDDLKDYEEEWVEKLTKAQEKYPKKLRGWERRAKIAKETGKKRPEKPIEPTRETFSIDPIELRGAVSFGPQYVFAKGKSDEGKTFSYMQKIEPGTYVYYGPISVDPSNGVLGTCYCMGSVQFEVKPGVITNMGNFLLAAPEVGVSSNAGIQMGVWVSNTVNLDPTGGEVVYDLPASLQAFPNEKADFRASGKVDNFYGLTIDRMPPIKGVLAYERDVVIDVKQREADAELAAEKAEAAADAIVAAASEAAEAAGDVAPSAEETQSGETTEDSNK
jgi:hypothetical protein